VRVNNHPLKVVGTLSRKGANMMGMDQDDIVLAPWRTIKFKVSGQSAMTANQSAATTTTTSATDQRYASGPASTLPTQSPTQQADYPPRVWPANVDQILVRIATEPQIPAGMRQIKALLHERHRIRSGQPDDFSLRDMTEISKAMGSTSQLMSGLLLCV